MKTLTLGLVALGWSLAALSATAGEGRERHRERAEAERERREQARENREQGENRKRSREEAENNRKQIAEDRKQLREDEKQLREDRKALREEKAAGGDITDEKANLEQDKRQLKDDRKDLKDDRKDLKEDAAERRKAATEARGEGVDQRQDRQGNRIEQGVKNGSLTADELAGLQAQQQAIANLETTIRGDGKITNDERKQIQSALNDASRQIFAEKHDAEGNQMPVYRYGKDITMNEGTTALLADPNLSKEQARAISHDFHEMTRLKRELASGGLSAEQQTAAQARYDALLNQYFTSSPAP